MIISISGKPGSGKSSVGKIIAEKLNMKYYDMGHFRRQIAKKKGITINELNKIGEKDFSTDKEADDFIVEKAKQEDNFVIVSRTAFHFIPKSFKVFVDVDVDEGAKRIFKHSREQERYKDFHHTKESVDKRDLCDTRRYKKYYSIAV
ncbi:MAG: cytidylate kinase family protein, partial [Candidatus Nanoarchaeia archaeon]|nr:cytidylate kinase family protein [Candidatus Nanoarchaeia archaeon]